MTSSDPYMKEIDRMRRLYEELQSDEEYMDDADDSDADPAYEEVSEHATDSEQELEDVEITECEQQAHTYKEKDGMEWSTTCPRKNVRTRNYIISHLPGARGSARTVKTFAHEIISSVICRVQEEVLVLLRHH
ncbi:hypothetical protein QE152_g5000 [Popillia japonica]|uniref:Uncharacterized protein n=1 Tax=Popillia japonica TaxID=7064 RepID=A0AAW1N006_POPJA